MFAFGWTKIEIDESLELGPKVASLWLTVTSQMEAAKFIHLLFLSPPLSLILSLSLYRLSRSFEASIDSSSIEVHCLALIGSAG